MQHKLYSLQDKATAAASCSEDNVYIAPSNAAPAAPRRHRAARRRQCEAILQVCFILVGIIKDVCQVNIDRKLRVSLFSLRRYYSAPDHRS